MDAVPSTTVSQRLSRLVGPPNAPIVMDARVDEDVATDPHLLPGANRRSYHQVARPRQLQ
jgi:hypothetical protein